MARLCLVLTAPTLKENMRILETCSPDMAELRVDLLENESAEDIAAFSSRIVLPMILTCRKIADGGRWGATDEERESFLLKCLEGSFSFLDLEEAETSEALVEKAVSRECRIIRSLHDFNHVPGDLEDRLQEMDRRGDLVKAAVMPQGIADLTRLFRTGMNWKKGNLILIGMGDYGVPSRILAHRMNSFLTFCSAPEAGKAAPGHMGLDTLQEVYRAGEIDDRTELYGIIGNPVLHTRSPQIHNNGLIQTGQKGVYVPFTVEDTAGFFELAELLGLKGFSVTVPHKQAVIQHLAHQSQAVRKIGACNTVVWEEGRWCGYNTDAHGFIAPLKEQVQELKGLKTAVIGAGGAARSAVYALIQEGCDTVVYNRTLSRAEALASEMGCPSGSLEEFLQHPSGTFDLIVQTSSSGMEGHSGGGNPIESYEFKGTEFLYDIIYTPPQTPLMEKAKKAGCSVLGGWSMLVEQAREQFRLFTGQELPKE